MINLPGTVAESTEDDYNDTVRFHLAPALGRKRLTKLTVVDLDKLWKAKREAGYSANSIGIMRTVLRTALGQAEPRCGGPLTCSRQLAVRPRLTRPLPKVGSGSGLPSTEHDLTAGRFSASLVSCAACLVPAYCGV